MSKCKCGCGEETELEDYITGHDLKHTYKLVDLAGGRDNLQELLSYSGPAKMDLVFLDDKTKKQIDRISPLDKLYRVGEVQSNIGGHTCWLITKVGEPTVENWNAIPPTLYFPVFGHPI